jgi:hypothetical protein
MLLMTTPVMSIALRAQSLIFVAITILVAGCSDEMEDAKAYAARVSKKAKANNGVVPRNATVPLKNFSIELARLRDKGVAIPPELRVRWACEYEGYLFVCQDIDDALLILEILALIGDRGSVGPIVAEAKRRPTWYRETVTWESSGRTYSGLQWIEMVLETITGVGWRTQAGEPDVGRWQEWLESR